ncbi:glutathione S-transferase family protein [Photobacterium nomapromontoriensis]|uniref:glutathione S-transferase family protein n=1 Tax=Photobacterium nomapromontoriensis TaxID=2910237 RepID=UPI003D14BAD9
MKIYSFPYSLPSYRARLAASLLGFDFEEILVDLSKNEQKSATFLAINPLGKIPAMADDHLIVTDSIAILRYLARKADNTHWYPESDIATAAQIDTLLSLVSNELYEGIEKARLINAFKMLPTESLSQCREITTDVLTILNTQLENKHFLTSDDPTIADIAAASTILYIHEASFHLDNYKNIEQWLNRVRSLEGFIEPTFL